MWHSLRTMKGSIANQRILNVIIHHDFMIKASLTIVNNFSVSHLLDGSINHVYTVITNSYITLVVKFIRHKITRVRI